MRVVVLLLSLILVLVTFVGCEPNTHPVEYRQTTIIDPYITLTELSSGQNGWASLRDFYRSKTGQLEFVGQYVLNEETCTRDLRYRCDIGSLKVTKAELGYIAEWPLKTSLRYQLNSVDLRRTKEGAHGIPLLVQYQGIIYDTLPDDLIDSNFVASMQIGEKRFTGSNALVTVQEFRDKYLIRLDAYTTQYLDPRKVGLQIERTKYDVKVYTSYGFNIKKDVTPISFIEYNKMLDQFLEAEVISAP